MRGVALLLLIANVVFFAWQYPQQRLLAEHQRAEAVAAGLLVNDQASSLMLLKELPPAIAEKVVTVNVGQPASRANGVVVSDKKALQCWTLGPFVDNRQADRGLTMLTAEGIKGRTRERKGSVLAGYRVQLPGQGSKVAAQRTLRELRGRGVKDIAIMEDNDRYFISLGFFSKEASANQRNAAVRKFGYQSLTKKVYRGSSDFWLELYQVTAPLQLDKAWGELSAAYPKIKRSSINCPKDR